MADFLKDEHPRPSVTVLVFKEEKVLLGKRISATASHGMYQAAGGKLDLGESLIACGVREVREETGVEISNPAFLCVTNVTHFPPKHHVLITLRADWKNGEPQTLEPDQCSGWEWYSLDALPSPLTPATENGIIAFKTGQNFFDR